MVGVRRSIRARKRRRAARAAPQTKNQTTACDSGPLNKACITERLHKRKARRGRIQKDVTMTEPKKPFSWTVPPRPKSTEEITLKAKRISILAPKNGAKEITPSQGKLGLDIERDADIDGIGMGVLSDGTPYLNQRGLAALCGVQNAHIGTISTQWNEVDQKPRIRSIKSVLEKAGYTAPAAHIEIAHAGQIYYCYPAEISLAVLEYYAFDAGPNCQVEARDNFRLLAGSKLRELIYRQVGYDPTHSRRFEKWHERIELNYQSAPRGYFHVFNEAHTIVYELIMAGADIGDKNVVDISIGAHWSKYWLDSGLVEVHAQRQKYPHRYPESHPQSKANPHESWCYPLSALGDYRTWLQDVYIEGGKFKSYLSGKVSKGELPPSVAQLAITALTQSGPPAIR